MPWARGFCPFRAYGAYRTCGAYMRNLSKLKVILENRQITFGVIDKLIKRISKTDFDSLQSINQAWIYINLSLIYINLTWIYINLSQIYAS